MCFPANVSGTDVGLTGRAYMPAHLKEDTKELGIQLFLLIHLYGLLSLEGVRLSRQGTAYKRGQEIITVFCVYCLVRTPLSFKAFLKWVLDSFHCIKN